MDHRKKPIFSTDIAELAGRLTGLTLAQAAELRVCLETVHGIRPAVSVSPGHPKPEPAPPPPEPTHFSVILAGLVDAEKKITVFRAVREITKLGLKETRELIEAAPSIVQTNLLKDEALALQKQLEVAGARVTLVPA